jgi:hypothetical protein
MRATRESRRRRLDDILKNPGKYLRALRDWAKLVREGADPIEAMHGHKCGPSCWHHMPSGKESTGVDSE